MIFGRFQNRLGEPIPGAEEQRLLRSYQNTCRGVRVLQTLSRQAMSPAQTVTHLERKLAAVPRLVEGWQRLRQLLRIMQGRPKHQLNAALQGLAHAYPELVEFPFPPGYAVGSVDHERAIVACELAKARWELAIYQRTGRIPGRLIRKP